MLPYDYGEKEKTANLVLKKLDAFVLPNKEFIRSSYLKHYEKEDEDYKPLSKISNDWDYYEYFHYKEEPRNYDYGILFFGPLEFEIILYENVMEVFLPVYFEFNDWFLEKNKDLIDSYTDVLFALVSYLGGDKILYYQGWSRMDEIFMFHTSIDKIINCCKKEGKRGKTRYVSTVDEIGFTYFVEPVRNW